MDQHIQTAKHVGDAAAIATTVAIIAGWLPAVAAFFTILYTAVRLYETRTVQRLIRGRRSRATDRA